MSKPSCAAFAAVVLLSFAPATYANMAPPAPPAVEASEPQPTENPIRPPQDVLPAIAISAVATDETYGYTEGNPIKVGGVLEGPSREHMYLALLRGPKGESTRFERQGSCCAFETPNGIVGGGLLDIYSVWIGEESEPKKLYINMYDYEPPLAPKGFTFITVKSAQ